VIGDATRPQGEGPKLLLHVCNDVGLWGPGFAKAVSARWKLPEREYLKAHAAGALTLGEAYFVEVGKKTTVGTLIACKGVRAPSGGSTLRLGSLRRALEKAAKRAKETGASVHMPRLGCGGGGGRWTDVEAVLAETLSGLAVVVYDLA
jgi:O-acetyl-ADP-ribose deacetylase (regulator of RNase III)